MKIVSIRMAEETWEAIQDEATAMGISASEFVREAAIFRLGYRWGGREELDVVIERLRDAGMLDRGY
jgi:hypothetical protein